MWLVTSQYVVNTESACPLTNATQADREYVFLKRKPVQLVFRNSMMFTETTRSRQMNMMQNIQELLLLLHIRDEHPSL